MTSGVVSGSALGPIVTGSAVANAERIIIKTRPMMISVYT